MELVNLLIVLIATTLSILLIYLIVVLIARRFKKETRRESIQKAIVKSVRNCGECGGNCEKFADDIISGRTTLESCNQLSNNAKEELKNLLDITPPVSGDKTAFVLCKGGTRAENQYGYYGAEACGYANKLYEGLKRCKSGCQACMDCAKVCPTDAIFKNKRGVAEVDPTLCIGCGACVTACPDKLLVMLDLDQDVMPACKLCVQKETGEEVHDYCLVGCTKCEECTKVCPTSAVYLENGLIKFDNSKCIHCYRCVYACPNSTITRILNSFEKNKK